MNTLDRKKPVLVTGATGYLASWIVKLLLDEGISVHATVRDKTKKEKYAHLLNIAKEGKGKLEIFEADLLKEGSFRDAMKDCELVIHSASPFQLYHIKDAEKELIDPALKGTRNVLNQVNQTETVKRVVLTSSMVAIYGDSIDSRSAPGGILTEQIWNTSSSPEHQPYSYSKMLAEKEAWKIVNEQHRWDLVVINPGFILGPSLDKNNAGFSNQFMTDLGKGKFRTGVPAGEIGVVDVRDAAKAHVLAGFTPTASGRHITAGYHISLAGIAKILKAKYPRLPLPGKPISKTLAWLVAPLLGMKRKYVKLNFNIDLKFDNSYVKKDLGLTFTPLEKTLEDHFEQLMNDGVIKRK